MNQMAPPDFIGIGTSRAGTTYLYKQLADHDDVWMPPLKELHYFDLQRSEGFFNKRHRQHILNLLRDIIRNIKCGRSTELFEIPWAVKYIFGKRTDNWYVSLFQRPDTKSIRGEITPAYSTLTPDEIRAIHKIAPQAKIIYMMRDPIERAWSSVTKGLGKKKRRNASSIPKQEIYNKFTRTGFKNRSNYLRTLNNWESIYPRDQIFIGFLDEIKENPSEFLNRLYTFLGISNDINIDEEMLRKSVNHTGQYQSDIPEEIEKYLANEYLQMNYELHCRFGRYATKWYNRTLAILNQPEA